MNNLSNERRRLAVLGGGIAAMSGGVGILTQRHPVAGWIWLGILLLLVIYVFRQLILIKRNERNTRLALHQRNQNANSERTPR